MFCKNQVVKELTVSLKGMAIMLNQKVLNPQKRKSTDFVGETVFSLDVGAVLSYLYKIVNTCNLPCVNPLVFGILDLMCIHYQHYCAGFLNCIIILFIFVIGQSC